MADDVPPSVHVRWFQVEVPELLSVAPLVLNATITWRPLTREESDACEAMWLGLPAQQRPSSSTLSRCNSSSSAVGPEQDSTRATDPLPLADDIPEDDDFMGVPIEREKLFEVDVRTMRVKPIYWQSSGPSIRVMRSVWMYDETKPLEEKLSATIEEAYMSVKPWQPSYADELEASRKYGVEALSKLAYPLGDTDYIIIFEEGGRSARLILKQSLVSQRLSSFFTFGNGKISPYEAGAPGVTMIYRGYDEAYARSHPVPTENGEAKDKDSRDAADSLPLGDGVNAPGPSVPQRNVDVPPLSPIAPGPDTPLTLRELPPSEDEYTDLILIVHGIGQGLTAQYESFNFVYAINYFRNVARKQANTPALASIMRSRHLQFLPVPWRTSMKFDLDAEAQSQGHHNYFTLSEVTPKGTIPWVREMTNSVLTDIPLFMSHHKGRMIESVCEQANRAYRLWCARNPNFEKRGRVHILAHSLGSALVADILSNQPTHVPRLSSLSTDPEEKRRMDKKGFLFDTHLLFTVGSPLSIFLRIQEAQLIARKGRERTMNSPDDEALDRVGLFGCLSVDSIFNIFNPSDPIAYLLNPTVDSQRAKDMQPTPIPNVQAAMLAPIRSGFGKFMLAFSSSPSSKKSVRRRSASRMVGNSTADQINPDAPPALNRGLTGDGMELFDSGKDPLALEGTKAERRFLALNPRGSLDYMLPGDGGFSEYVDMLTAHSAYWSDPSLASFLLAEIFATKVDLARTSIGAGN